jgi:Transketolase
MNTGAIHGAAIGAEEIAETKKILGFDPESHFQVDDDVIAHTRSLADRAAEARVSWEESFAAWSAREPERFALFERLMAGEIPDLTPHLPTFEGADSLATRAASGQVINALAAVLPELWGGSADLAESNLTTIKGAPSFAPAEHSTAHWDRQPVWPGTALWYPRARNGRNCERHCPPWSDQSIRRKLFLISRTTCRLRFASLR